MCYNYVSPVTMICGHPGPDGFTKDPVCNQDPCETGGIVVDVWLGATFRRWPCGDCIAAKTWIEWSPNRWRKAVSP